MLRGERHSLSPSAAFSEHAGKYKELLCTHDVEMVCYLIRESVLHLHIVRERRKRNCIEADTLQGLVLWRHNNAEDK